MTLKRTFAAFDLQSSTPPLITTQTHPPPQKRYRSTPTGSSSPSTATSSSSLATPGPFSTPYAYTPPSDSPTNPFGRIRKLALTGSKLTLPRATSFSKHLPLRFQIFRDAEGEGGEGTYRIVQVPLNYTFKHLQKLLFFLFDEERDSASGSSRSRAHVPPAELLRRHLRGQEGHLFEVQDSIRMYKIPATTTRAPRSLFLSLPSSSALPSRVGHIRTGRTWAKLSSVRDPFCRSDASLFRDGRCDGEVDAVDEGEGEDGEEDWIWEAEEDFTLGHVWPEGGDLKRGCIYHHSPTTQVHITINTTRIPGRKGVGNKPFVFFARGRGWGNSAVLFSASGDEEAEEEKDSDEDGDEDNSDEDGRGDGSGARIDPRKWNGHEAFEKFLKWDAERTERAERGLAPRSKAHSQLQEDDEDDEGPLSLSSAPMKLAATATTSSPFPHLPLETPYPQSKFHRLRLQYATRRMERLNKRGLEELGEEVGLDKEDEGGDELEEEEI